MELAGEKSIETLMTSNPDVAGTPDEKFVESIKASKILAFQGPKRHLPPLRCKCTVRERLCDARPHDRATTYHVVLVSYDTGRLRKSNIHYPIEPIRLHLPFLVLEGQRGCIGLVRQPSE